jgi:hypothetical protein
MVVRSRARPDVLASRTPRRAGEANEPFALRPESGRADDQHLQGDHEQDGIQVIEDG